MAPQLEPLARSESKANFYRRLGLSSQKESDNRLYKLMKEEAVTGRERILSNPDSLIPQLRNNPTIRPPYSNIQIRETSVHQEILRIYRDASPHTRPIYERGHDASGLNEENWIIRWMLWHVFRFRDSRNNPKQARRKRSCSSSSDETALRSSYWDPVKDAQRTTQTQ